MARYTRSAAAAAAKSRASPSSPVTLSAGRSRGATVQGEKRGEETPHMEMSPAQGKRQMEARKASPNKRVKQAPVREAPAAIIEKNSSSPTQDEHLASTKWNAFSKHAHGSPYPDFARPTPQECREAHDILEQLHGDRIRQEWADPDAPSQEYPYVMDALVVAALSQATSWANAKRAMKNMKLVYGSTFAYDAIVEGGLDKLRDTIRPGGMQNKKSKMLMEILNEVKARYGKWDLQFLFDATDDEAVKEVMSYKGLGPKCAYCLISICLKREAFAVDTHIYRISGLWGWRPRDAPVQKAQAHLDARIPNELKFALHYHLIAHGATCPACRGNGDRAAKCEFRDMQRANLEAT